MIRLGSLCPIFFNPQKDKGAKDICYTQKFHSSDVINIQVFTDNGEVVTGAIKNLCSGASISIQFSTYTVNDATKMFYSNITSLSESYYSIVINGTESEPFSVVESSAILEETALIRCSHLDNNSGLRNIFWIGNNQQFFYLRVEAGFKPFGIDQRIENEFFRDQTQSITQLYSIPYEVKTLTIGDASGVPYWFAQKINQMLCVSMFQVNGSNYIRSEGSVPEKQQISEDGQVFWYSIALEESENNLVGIGGESEPPNSTGTAFKVLGAKDGEMLVFKESEGAFINTDRIEP